MTRFFLGAHHGAWLRDGYCELFVSDVTLRKYKRLPEAATDWALDSGGFSVLQQHGRWTVKPGEYVTRVKRYRDEIGRLVWAAPQDWMCEQIIIDGGKAGPLEFAGTHLSVEEHQRRTVTNLIELRSIAPDLPIIPVLQGWERDDYLRCIDLYDAAGVDLSRESLVGVGTVCRRQHTGAAGLILESIHKAGVTRLHGFGFKVDGLLDHGRWLTSADSMAWSYDGRYSKNPCPRGLKSCANCRHHAYDWRDRLVNRMARRGQQEHLFDFPEMEVA